MFVTIHTFMEYSTVIIEKIQSVLLKPYSARSVSYDELT